MITEQEYVKRRTALSKKLKKSSVMVLLSAKQKVRSNDTHYPYRQNSNFYYLSGFKEENSALVIVKTKTKIKTYLFVQKKDKQLELWNGRRVGKEKAKELFIVDDIFTIEQFFVKIEKIIKKREHLYFDFSMEDERIDKLRKIANKMYEHNNIMPLIGSLRLIKSEKEIEVIKQALAITKEAHHHAMKYACKLEYEYELQAEIEYVFKKRGAYSDAYTSIVACGNSANTLHYINNDKKLIKGELILIDAGCEYEYYASDITRTIPVNRCFSKAQAQLYNMVLGVQENIIQMIQAQILRSDIQKKSEELLCLGLIELKILKGNVEELLKQKAHKKYYPHGIGHWMGIDVHDEAPYSTKSGKEIMLLEGMVLTIEPAIYIDELDLGVPEEFRGIGIRIEDDILVTKDGCENLSIEIVKTIEDIQNL